jgi:hypothetical protein
MKRLLRSALIAFTGLMLSLLSFADRGVVVNGEPLPDDIVAQLESSYRTKLQPGRYWYDPVSGLWGLERGPTAGQISPGLKLGGRLRADASGGGTGVFFNGRELHKQDVALLYQLSGVVIPGRYWINAAGVGGFENGPPFFDLRALAAQRGGGRSWSHSGPGGHMGSDGKCTYFLDPQTGSSVMTGDCN